MTHPLAPLLAWRQWIVVKLVPLPNGKTDKLPVDPRTCQVTGKGSGGAHNPAVWLDYATAAATAQALGANHCVGFVITAADPFWCLDIDGALQVDGTWSALALTLMQALPGTVVEVSQSGKGLHIWGQGAVPEHASKNVPLGIELYTELRFIAIGSGHVGDMTQPCPYIAAVAAHYFPPRVGAGVDLPDEGPRADWRGPADTDAGNADLLRRMLQSRSAAAQFGGGGASFADLYHADVAALSRAYPPDSGSSEPFDRSSADAGLFQHAAFWTGCDQGRMWRLVQGSALKREKWDRDDYIRRTITRAVTLQRDVLQDKPPAVSPFESVPPAPVAAPPAPATPPVPPGVSAAPTPAAVPPAPPLALPAAVAGGMQPRGNDPFVSHDQQAAMFAGCTYVTDYHQVLCPGGRLLSPDRFKTIFGGHVFVLDKGNTKTTKDAFEAFTQSQALRATVVDGTAFIPAKPFGIVIESEGRKRVNTYWPADVQRIRGDATPFLNHLAKLLPNEIDRRIMLYFMAGLVQQAGHKFQWFPLLVGCEGNGKTFLSECAAFAVGHRYTHWPRASNLGNQFNGWLFGKLLYCVEDLKIGDQAELWERLKPMVTGGRMEVEQKGIDQVVSEIVGNFICNSNHKDAIRATLGDRRVCHLWTGQMTPADMQRDGMTPAYFKHLYEWARAGGFAIVAELLHTIEVPPEYGLGWLLGRAPRTSSTLAAQSAGLGRIEQEVIELIEQDTVGFRGGWVSGVYLDRHLQGAGRGVVIAPNKRRALMQSIGYDWHPALVDGRVTSVVLPDGARPRLYVRTDHHALALTTAADVMRAYSTAQGMAA